MFYYKSEKDAKAGKSPLGSIPLTDATVMNIDESQYRKSFAFAVTTILFRGSIQCSTGIVLFFY
jgi:hypothetical protein